MALLGTRFTMEEDFYVARLARRGLDVVVPDAAGRDLVHRVIYDELVQGVVRDASRAAYLEVIDGLLARGAQGVIAGCTEIELLVTPSDVACRYFPTTRLHALAAVDAALATSTTAGRASGSPPEGRKPLHACTRTGRCVRFEPRAASRPPAPGHPGAG